MHLFFVISIIGGNITLDDIQFDLALLDWNCQGLHKAYTISVADSLNIQCPEYNNVSPVHDQPHVSYL